MNIVLSVAFVTCWSSGFIGAKLGAADAGVATVLMWRFLPLALLLLVAAWATGRRGPRLARRTLGRQVAIGALSQSGYLFTVYWAISLGVNTGTTALIDGIQPLVTAALLGPFLGAAVSVHQWAGLGLGVGGVAIVTLADAARQPAIAWWAYLIPMLGMLALVAATFIARRSSEPVGPLPGLVIHCSTSAVVFTVLAVATGAAVPPAELTFWVAVTWLVVLSTFGGYGLYWLLLRRVGVTRLSTLMFLIAPVTAVWGAVMFDESFTLATAIGLGIGLTAVVVVHATAGPRKG